MLLLEEGDCACSCVLYSYLDQNFYGYHVFGLLGRSVSSHDGTRLNTGAKETAVDEEQLQHRRLRPSAGDMFDRISVRFCTAQ